MAFTPETPTTPGYFLWKLTPEDSPSPVFLVPDDACATAPWEIHLSSARKDGWWCRLVPAAETLPLATVLAEFVPKSMFVEELENAYCEGADDYRESGHTTTKWIWARSRAKKVMEGKV